MTFIQTTHVGSLPRNEALADLLIRQEAGEVIDIADLAQVSADPTDIDEVATMCGLDCTMNVLLGPTSAGKTSLMRLMAGLDVPTSGRILWHGADVTGQRVQDRKVAMVYQQFINYPAMTVYENIASPMRLMGKSGAEVDRAVRETAEDRKSVV